MRLIPVIDLKDGAAVHAVRGERGRYRPVNSRLVSRGNARALLQSFARLGLQELYIADLDAIQGLGQHRTLIAELVRQVDMIIMVDAGAANLAQAREVLALGAQKVIIASETLVDWGELAAMRAQLPASRLVFSLDMRSGRVLARNPDLAALDPLAILGRVQDYQIQEVILLDLARVGTSRGLDQGLIAAAHAAYPDLRLLAGGGVRHAKDLQDLQRAGAAGALIATALHNGTLEQAQVAELAVA
jgi:phosphoribosylformimino-5-aminoimidazole carboxamide ribotide isomerase